MAITVNQEQRLYVIPSGAGYSTLGFANAQAHADQIARALKRPDLVFKNEDLGALSGYQKYQAAVLAWGRSHLTGTTYFDPGTDATLKQRLEALRKSQEVVRLILGDTATGRTWLDEHDVVGRIGRSTGMLKVPLLVPIGERAGGAMLSAHVLAVINWSSGRYLYRHARLQLPNLAIDQQGAHRRPWRVTQDGQEIASFRDLGQAGAYVAFMRGATIEPRVFQ